MKSMFRKLLACALSLLALGVHAQSVPNGGITQGQIWTTAQWLAAFQAKVDVSGGTLNSPIINSPTFNITGLTQCLHVSTSGVVSGTGVDCGSGGGSSNWNALVPGTNNSGSFYVGTGSLLGPSGSGIVSANELNGSTLGAYFASPPAFGTTTPAAGEFTTLTATGNFTTNVTGLTQCLQASSSGLVTGTGSSCGGSGGSGTVGSGTTNQIGYYAGSGTTISGASLGGNLIMNGSTLATSQLQDMQSGTSYTICAIAPCSSGNFFPTGTPNPTDAGTIVSSDNASAVAWTLPQATTTGFTAGFSFDVENRGAGTLTITPTTSTINGNSTLTLVENTGCTITSDGVNYQVSACSAVAPAGAGGPGSFTTLAASGTTTLHGVLDLYPGNGSGISAPSWTTSGIGLSIPSVIYTDTTGSGTISNEAAYSIAAPTLSATNTSVTISSLDTLYLGAPVAGTNVTASNTYSLWAAGSIYSNSGGIIGPSIQAQGTSPSGTGIYRPSASPATLGFSLNSVEEGSWNTSANGGLLSFTTIYSGKTSFTVSGCGTAGLVNGSGTTGSFTVGTGASTCTFTFTINGATGMQANNGWVANVDDVTAHLHCTNTTGGSTTIAVVLCNSTVATSDTIVAHFDPY